MQFAIYISLLAYMQNVNNVSPKVIITSQNLSDLFLIKRNKINLNFILKKTLRDIHFGQTINRWNTTICKPFEKNKPKIILCNDYLMGVVNTNQFNNWNKITDYIIALGYNSTT